MMRDLISRQAAIDAIAQCTNCGDEDTLRGYVLKHNLDNGWTGGILEALDAVKDLPPAQPEPQWIPVSGRLPETEEFVLASLTGKYRNITFEHACEIADYADGEWCVYAYPHMSAEKCEELIEAWMPLPEAYKPTK
jgi:hypothetical protein